MVSSSFFLLSYNFLAYLAGTLLPLFFDYSDRSGSTSLNSSEYRYDRRAGHTRCAAFVQCQWSFDSGNLFSFISLRTLYIVRYFPTTTFSTSGSGRPWLPIFWSCMVFHHASIPTEGQGNNNKIPKLFGKNNLLQRSKC